jgi:hypothetical protein
LWLPLIVLLSTDRPTIADAELIEEVEKGKTEFVHYTHKTLSAAVARRDVLLLRSWEQSGNKYFTSSS